MRSRRTSALNGILPLTLLAHLLHPILTTAQNFPYIPTRLYASSQSNQPFVYVLSPPSSTSTTGLLTAINTSNPFNPSQPPITTLASTLPFLHDGQLAYTSSLDPNGALNVLVGDCSSGANGASLWTFSPTLDDKNWQGSWAQQTINSRAISDTASQVGVNYLAASVSFTSTSKQDASIYAFAGMCPYSNTTDADWQADAAYSNQLLILDHSTPTEYDFELGSGRGQPISEAGFSITPLDPTSSTAADGTQATQQNFLLLGGHTQEAFINMSQVALFSLPQASWAFLPVSGGGEKTDHKSRQSAQETDPRSGHTAILSADGSKVIMFGGWVGDISTPAEPQLAVLNVGAGYGGSGDWSWTSAPTQASLSNGASGIYGHGATMLDGDVMLIMGGWTIPAQGKKSRRAGSPTTNTQNLLFNVTSAQWIDTYVPPPSASTVSSAAEGGGLLATKQQKIGLGVGLTFAILAILIAALIGWLISKRFKKQLQAKEEELREKEIEDLHRFDAHYDPIGTGYYVNSGSYQRPDNIWDGRNQPGTYGGEPAPNIWRNDSIREAERSGMDLDIPSPQRGLRRSMASRQMHSSGRGFDERRISRGSGMIHPIEETEEEEHQLVVASPSEQLDDPFKDPLSQANVHSEGEQQRDQAVPEIAPSAQPLSPAEERTRQTAQWVEDWAAAASNRNQSGRVSPDKSERTHSTLSDISTISQLTARTHASSSSSGQSRAVSTPSPDHQLLPGSRRSLRILPAAFNPFAASSTSPTSPWRSRNSLTSASQPPHTADSFRTAATTFATLQSESDALLGPARPGQAGFKPNAGAATPKASGSFNPYGPDTEPTFMLGHRQDAHKAPTGKVGSWVGSVRRAVANAGRSASLTSTGIASANRQRAMAQVGPSGNGLGGLTVYDSNGRGEESPASSPTKKGGITREYFANQDGEVKPSEMMRRSASEGATSFLVKRKGAKDWGWNGSPSSCESPDEEFDVSEQGKERSHSMATNPRPVWQGPEGEEEHDEWDVEKAVEARNVQVMFSVPKERLRVVNADVDAASLASGRSVSGGRYDDIGVGRGEGDGGLYRARSRSRRT